ncbi:hypothetical protein D3C86_2092580 [compost metagenome]
MGNPIAFFILLYVISTIGEISPIVEMTAELFCKGNRTGLPDHSNFNLSRISHLGLYAVRDISSQ